MGLFELMLNSKTKSISKEALAKCVEVGINDHELAAKIRADTSFDVVKVSSPLVDLMEVKLIKYKGKVELFNTYCGDSIRKTLEKLDYANKGGYRFPSCVKIK